MAGNYALEYYTDSIMTNKLQRNDSGEPVLSLGITDRDSINTTVIYVVNTLDEHIRLRGFIQDPDVEFNYPDSLNAGEKGEIVFTYKPATDRLESLKAVWGFDIDVG